MKVSKALTVYRGDYTPPDFQVSKVELDVNLFEEETIVISHLKVKAREPNAPSPKPLILDGEQMELLEINLDGQPLHTLISVLGGQRCSRCLRQCFGESHLPQYLGPSVATGFPQDRQRSGILPDAKEVLPWVPGRLRSVCALAMLVSRLACLAWAVSDGDYL